MKRFLAVVLCFFIAGPAIGQRAEKPSYKKVTSIEGVTEYRLPNGLRVLTLPDPGIRWNEERGHYDHGEIDWDEFNAVVRGDGPCNRQRIAHRVRAHDDGRWVRDAAAAYASKHAPRTEAA